MTSYYELLAEFPELGAYKPWSVEWYAAYRDLHAARYPDADQSTRDNLAMFVERAKAAAERDA